MARHAELNLAAARTARHEAALPIARVPSVEAGKHQDDADAVGVLDPHPTSPHGSVRGARTDPHTGGEQPAVLPLDVPHLQP